MHFRNKIFFRVSVVVTLIYCITLEGLRISGSYFYWESWIANESSDPMNVHFYLGFAPILFWGYVWIVSGMKRNKVKNERKVNNIIKSASIDNPVILATSFIRNSGLKFNGISKKSSFSNLDPKTGPKFGWAILWLSILYIYKEHEDLKEITILSLKRILASYDNLLMESFDNYIKEKTGEKQVNTSESLRSIGLNFEKGLSNIDDKHLIEIDKAIKETLDRILLDREDKFTPLLNQLSYGNISINKSTESILNQEYEMLNNLCFDTFEKGKGMASKIIEKYTHHVKNQSNVLTN